MDEFFKKFQEEFIQSKPNERIRILRRQKNLTIKQAAEEFITTEKVWSSWESGKTEPRKRSWRKIASVLGVNEETIFGKRSVYL